MGKQTARRQRFLCNRASDPGIPRRTHVCCEWLLVIGLQAARREAAASLKDERHVLDVHRIFNSLLRTADDLRHGLITLDVRESGGSQGSEILQAIREYEALHLRPHGLRVELGGDLTAWATVKQLMVATQLQSIRCFRPLQTPHGVISWNSWPATAPPAPRK